MTPFAAIDYITATKAAAEVQQVTFEAVPELAKKLLATGAASLALNCCPSCRSVRSTPLDAVADMHTFAMFWELRRATQIYFGQREVHRLLAVKETSARRNVVELIRDPIDCGIP